MEEGWYSCFPKQCRLKINSVLSFELYYPHVLYFLLIVSGRFLVHRYSVLQQHAEANGIEGVDDLDTLEVGKTHYHDDSDEV